MLGSQPPVSTGAVRVMPRTNRRGEAVGSRRACGQLDHGPGSDSRRQLPRSPRAWLLWGVGAQRLLDLPFLYQRKPESRLLFSFFFFWSRVLMFKRGS